MRFVRLPLCSTYFLTESTIQPKPFSFLITQKIKKKTSVLQTHPADRHLKILHIHAYALTQYSLEKWTLILLPRKENPFLEYGISVPLCWTAMKLRTFCCGSGCVVIEFYSFALWRKRFQCSFVFFFCARNYSSLATGIEFTFPAFQLSASIYT